MAQFCTKCGAPLGEGMSFCTGCGATVGAPSGPPAKAAAPPASPALAATRPAPALEPTRPMAAAAPAAKSGSPVLKIVLIVLAVLILLGLIGAASCVYMVYRAKKVVTQAVHQLPTTYPTRAGTREVQPRPMTPGAAPTPPAGPVVDVGAAVYPGATPWGGGSQMSMGTTTVKSQEYLTDDSVDKVLAFYKDKLGPNAMVTQSGGQAAVQLIDSNRVLTVAIKPDSSTGKTRISINSMGK